MFKFLKRIFSTEPEWDCVEDMTGRSLDMNYWIIAMGINLDWPGTGDLIIELDSCGMGATVRRDQRWRVTELREPYPTSFWAVNRDGHAKILHIHYLRQHVREPRVWFLVS